MGLGTRLLLLRVFLWCGEDEVTTFIQNTPTQYTLFGIHSVKININRYIYLLLKLILQYNYIIRMHIE